MSLPPNYKKWIERVSNIVSFVFPFKWTPDERRYKEWLYKNNIDEKSYLNDAQTMWTFVHLQLENYIDWKDVDKEDVMWEENKQEIIHWIEFLDNLSADEYQTEVYVRDKEERFQGSLDLLYKKDGKTILADWKTFGICKKRYWLNNKYTIPTKKRKKVELQMSIYAYAMKQAWTPIDELQLLFLHTDGCKVVSFKPLPDEEIEALIIAYKEKKKEKNNIIIINPIKNMYEI